MAFKAWHSVECSIINGGLQYVINIFMFVQKIVNIVAVPSFDHTFRKIYFVKYIFLNVWSNELIKEPITTVYKSQN